MKTQIIKQENKTPNQNVTENDNLGFEMFGRSFHILRTLFTLFTVFLGFLKLSSNFFCVLLDHFKI